MIENNRRIATALVIIAKSLRTLAEDTKANKEMKIEIFEKVNNLETALLTMKDDPFNLKGGTDK